MENYVTYLMRTMMETGNTTSIVLIIAVISLSTAIIFLWKANTSLQEKISELHEELVKKTEDYSDKAISQSREITTAITALMTVVSAQGNDERHDRDDRK
jgi:hypothetical protein